MRLRPRLPFWVIGISLAKGPSLSLVPTVVTKASPGIYLLAIKQLDEAGAGEV
jgi:hypothetical protein